MKLSENAVLVLMLLPAVAVTASVFYYVGFPPSIDRAFQVVGWMAFIVSAFSLIGFLLGVLKYEYYSPQLFSVTIASAFMGAITFYVPSASVNEAEQRACAAVGAEWKYLGDEEGYGCRKEYQSCGPDENRPGFTICEKKFKRVQPEAN